MGWRLSTWLVLARLLQLLGSFIPGAMNGWLLYYIYTNHLGLADTMVALEALVAITFVYTSLSLLVIHTSRRAERTAWVACSICFDIVFCLVDVAIVSILSYTGVPANCSGLTTFDKGDSNFSLAAHGYSTIRFSNEQDGHRGELDKYCGMERAFYFVTIVVILSYIVTIALSVLRICKLNLYSKGEVEHLLEERENMIRLELKIHETETPAQSPTPPASNATTAVVPKDDDRDLEAALASSGTTSRPRAMPRAMPSYSRPTLAVPTSSSSAAGTPLAGPSSSYHHHHHHHHQQPHRPDIAVSPISPVSAMSDDVIPASPLSPAASATLPLEAGFILSSTEIHANLAMITDGSRYGGPQQVVDGGGVGGGHNQLPPYSPGNHRQMSGHGDESNDIRLSEYVKGATRAQDMKDEGGY